MKNFRQVKEHWEDSFGKRAVHGNSYGHWQGDQSHPYAANRASSLREENVLHASVSQGPPPSFLVQTPLGTPHKEAVEFMPRAEIPVRRQQEEFSSPLPQYEKAFEQTNQAPRMLKKNITQPKRQERFHKGADKNGMVHRWVNEEVRLSMSKMSILSTVLGLLFLGILFFIIGFLVAVSTLKTEETHDSQSAWKASNAPEEHGGKKGGLGAVAGRMGGAFVGSAVRKEMAPLGKAFGHAAAIVPAPLQPFARYGIGSAHREVQGVGKAINPFATRRGGPQEQQQYSGNQQQPQGMFQQYAAPQGQAFASPAAYPAGGYQQPGAIPQSGYAQGYPPVQQAMQQPMMQPMQQPVMQQSYYQQPYNQQAGPQQYMAPQQMMPPQQVQMAPQQMMQQPQYQQQMPPQPGYYR